MNLDKSPYPVMAIKKNTPLKLAIDTGLAVTLVLLIVGWVRGSEIYNLGAAGTVVLTIFWPSFFFPLYHILNRLSQGIGGVISKIILTAIYFLVIFPIGLFRRSLLKDSLALKQWQASKQSVFVVREHRFSANDLEKPF